MTRTRFGSSAVIVVALAFSGDALIALAQPQRPASTDSVETLMGAAIHQEEVAGNLEAAIATYKKVIADRRASRAILATAWVRLGRCYETLGSTEARKAYERVISEFGEQTEAVALARTRLNRPGGGATSNGPTTQRVSAAPGSGHVSPDGRYLASNRDGNLALWEVVTGNARPLHIDKPAGIETYPLGSTFSPDGKHVAVEWYYESDYRGRLWVVGTAENAPTRPRVMFDNPEVSSISPYDWSRDGKWIAVQVHRRDHTAQIALVKVDDGSLRVLRSTEWIGASFMAFSPDSKSLAYDRPEGEGKLERDVFIIAVDGTREVQAVANPGDDRLVGWSPDGQRLLFRSDRGGAVGLWALPFRGGAPQANVEFVNDFGNGRSMGLTDAGALYYSVLLGGADIFVASFDSASGQLSSAPVRPIRQFNGLNQTPEWSADGRYLAYSSKRDPLVPSPITLVISSAETGQVIRELRPTLSYLLYPRWSPDGRKFVARGGDLKGRSGIVRFDATTGEAALVVPNEVCSGLPFWSSSSDGTFFCFDFAGKRILQVDVDSGDVRRALPSASQGNAASPDGRYLVPASDASLTLLSLSDGTARELLRFTQDTRIGNWASITFTPDSQQVAFAGKVRGEYGMWLVPIDGGQPHKINVDATSITMWRFNPKTWQVAYAPSNVPSFEMRRMENFLPVANRK